MNHQIAFCLCVRVRTCMRVLTNVSAHVRADMGARPAWGALLNYSHLSHVLEPGVGLASPLAPGNLRLCLPRIGIKGPMPPPDHSSGEPDPEVRALPTESAQPSTLDCVRNPVCKALDSPN